MLRFIAKRYAKAQYQFRQLVEAETNELHAKLAARLAKEHRDNAAQLTKEADQMEERIRTFTDMEAQGYWLCEDGHENYELGSTVFDKVEISLNPICASCGKPTKLIKRDHMTGQEKYESDKERGEAQDIANQKRAQAEEEMKSADESEKASKYFRSIAQNNRNVAEKLRRV